MHSTVVERLVFLWLLSVPFSRKFGEVQNARQCHSNTSDDKLPSDQHHRWKKVQSFLPGLLTRAIWGRGIAVRSRTWVISSGRVGWAGNCSDKRRLKGVVPPFHCPSLASLDRACEWPVLSGTLMRSRLVVISRLMAFQGTTWHGKMSPEPEEE